VKRTRDSLTRQLPCWSVAPTTRRPGISQNRPFCPGRLRGRPCTYVGQIHEVGQVTYGSGGNQERRQHGDGFANPVIRPTDRGSNGLGLIFLFPATFFLTPRALVKTTHRGDRDEE
jgi:hypothetical protein